MNMKRLFFAVFLFLLSSTAVLQTVTAQQRRPIDHEHPLWLVHVDVWYAADPQKIIDLIPDDIKPYVCLNLSLSCGYDKERNIYKMPRSAVRTYKSWASVCQHNGMWFTCQPASGGHTHIQDYDLETFEYFFKQYPNFLGWNYAEQFWGFDEPGDKSSSKQTERWALFAKLVEMSHQYGGFLTVSFCGNIWSHPLNPVGEMKRNKNLLAACRKYPESILWLYKYTTSSCFYNNESVTISPFISGLAKNYGVRYDNCGWNGAMDALFGEGHGKKYPAAAGIGTVMEQTGINGGAVWDGPELTWREECFHEVNKTTVDGYQRRKWEQFRNFKGVWLDMFRKVIDGTLRIPSREEVVGRTKIAIVNDLNSGNDEDKYAGWGNLYDGLYKQTDPFNRGNGQWMDNFCYFKKTGRYAAIPVCVELYDDLAKQIPVQVMKSKRNQHWSSVQKKVDEFQAQYPEISTGDLFVARMGNQLVTYTPYTYLNKKTTAEGRIPLLYNTCDSLILNYGKLSSGLVREYADSLAIYLNNFRSDTTKAVKDVITVKGATAEPTFTQTKRNNSSSTAAAEWDAATGTYTLSVSHMGPVDIVIRCNGSATDRQEASQLLPLPLPKQPEESVLPIVIEAEDMDTKSVKSVAITNSGWYAPDMKEFAGNGYVEMGTSKSGSLRHQLKLKKAGEYTIAVRYSSATKDGEMQANVNGEKLSFDIQKSGKNEWVKSTFTAQLKEGVNDLRLNNTAGIAMTIDQIIYIPEGTEAEQFIVNVREAENGSITSDVAKAAEGQTVTLMVNPAEGYVLKELKVINSVYYTMNKTIAFDADANEVIFVMPDDNVVIQPVFIQKSAIEEEANTVYKLDFSTVGEGAMPQGWVCVQENNETHQYPDSYGQGARTFLGFTGYQGGALYWRKQKAEYGSQSKYPLTLEPGNYKLAYALAAWKEQPKYKVRLLNASGSAIATSNVFTATPNAGGDRGNVSKAVRRELPFTITEKGKYTIRFTNETGGTALDEFLLLECRIVKESATGITPVLTSAEDPEAIYDLRGVRQQGLRKGLNIIRTADGKTKKVFK